MVTTIIITMRATAISRRERTEAGPWPTRWEDASINVPAAETSQGHSALPLFAWLSPSFPVGSFAFSHGMEWAVHQGTVRDLETTRAWIGALLTHGSLRNDVILASCAWSSVRATDAAGLREAAELAVALSGCRERHLETSAQGTAFVTALKTAWMTPKIAWALEALRTEEIAYPVALAIGGAGHAIERHPLLEAFALALVQNLVSAAIRLSVIGQSDGQRAIASLMPSARRLAAEAEVATLDDLGGAAFHSDIAAIKHETQYTRLFRS
ncbi:Urease accessory protein UreF [Candidatus Filomicrobium marinum]|nr:urease accessory UreF family protein [Candidatus Filomicrobium marinum]CFX18985.1 Urease accessory protein UreF [Candidatus Filomicrobium marinum]